MPQKLASLKCHIICNTLLRYVRLQRFIGIRFTCHWPEIYLAIEVIYFLSFKGSAVQAAGIFSYSNPRIRYTY